MIRVLYTIPNFDTAGSGKALLNIADGLDRELFEPCILCKHDRGPFFETVKKSGITIHIADYETPMRPVMKGIRNAWKNSRVLKTINPDLIHSFHYSSDYSEALAARFARIPWMFSKKNMNWGGNSKNSWKLRSSLAKKIILQNSAMKSRFYATSDKTVLIPRGVNTNEYSLNGSSGSNASAKTIVCVANLVRVKGVETLLEAFTRVQRSSGAEGWNLKLVGDDTTEYAAKLKSRFGDLIDTGKVEFTGKVTDVKSELASSSIFVLPTRSTGEGSPVSMLEAMSMGLIVIGSRTSGIEDQLGKLGEEHMFEAGSADQLSHKILGFIAQSESMRRQLGAQIVNYCRDEWDISVEIARHQALYQEILGA